MPVQLGDEFAYCTNSFIPPPFLVIVSGLDNVEKGL
jgi:hypothetical protein